MYFEKNWQNNSGNEPGYQHKTIFKIFTGSLRHWDFIEEQKPGKTFEIKSDFKHPLTKQFCLKTRSKEEKKLKVLNQHFL